MRRVYRIFHWIDQITNCVAAIALMLTFVLVFLNVILRYLFDAGFAWSEEGARYALMALIIFGIVQATHKQEHFSVDLLIKKVPSHLKKILLFLQTCIILGATMIFITGSYTMMLLNWDNVTPAMHIPAWLPYAWVFVSSCISALHLIFHLLTILTIIPAEELMAGGEESC